SLFSYPQLNWGFINAYSAPTRINTTGSTGGFDYSDHLVLLIFAFNIQAQKTAAVGSSRTEKTASTAEGSRGGLLHDQELLSNSNSMPSRPRA
ncbi:MAG: hypothetical protein IJQ02_13185, partial [Oscillospiraceae bacterium]|nr:hypothetical protein [Oscillospiraceae bacterium]